MRVQQRDYYEVLGVRRDANGVEIKRAFRGMARRLHPDVAPRSELDTFHEVVAAYDVLSHPGKRSVYDRLGFRGRRRQAARPAPPVPPIELALAWYEADRGASKHVEFEELLSCSGCGGVGVPGGALAAECVACRGTGRLTRVIESPTLRLLEVQTCPTCAGVGHAPAPTCLTCGGRGATTTARSLRVRIPAGVHDGDLIQVEGVERRFRLNVAPRPRDSSVVLLAAGLALACALGLLVFLALR